MTGFRIRAFGALRNDDFVLRLTADSSEFHCSSLFFIVSRPAISRGSGVRTATQEEDSPRGNNGLTVAARAWTTRFSGAAALLFHCY
jgi:hypothetical protein